MLFIYYFWLRWVFVAMHRLSLVAVSGGYALIAVRQLLTAVAFLLQSVGSRFTGISSCST